MRRALPGGGMDPGESPLEAAEREVREETGWSGLVIERLRWSSAELAAGREPLRPP
ncbi:NUDIX domain-containing protein [Streptomyces althioticus]|uniref:NUDIX domain-containing protein n=1 Tax=Streptomyces althioticus TaxID=83380 RepID=UPI00369CB8C4